MAKELSGNLQAFANLEHLDPGSPKTTDLDEELKLESEPSSKDLEDDNTKNDLKKPNDNQQQESEKSLATETSTRTTTTTTTLTTTNMDKEDVVTVKYLPMKMLAPDNGDDADIEKFQDQFGHPKPGDTTHGSQQRPPITSSVRVVEHVRKNLTLFESNRETYERSSNLGQQLVSSNDCNSRGGHLQRALKEKQSSSNTVRYHCGAAAAAASRNFSDQYTQYRASDFSATRGQVGDTTRLYLNTNPQQAQGSDTAPTGHPRIGADVTGVKKLKNASLQLDKVKTTALDSTKATADYTITAENKPKDHRRHPSRLRRSVSSLNELLKRPSIDFAKFRVKFQQQQQQQHQPDVVDEVKHPLDNQQQVNYYNQNTPEQQQHYKTPVASNPSSSAPASQPFSSSSSLYLLPAPDSTVHIATRVVRDIILAHQRYKLSSRGENNDSSGNLRRHTFGSRQGSKLVRLFKSYSLRRQNDRVKFDNTTTTSKRLTSSGNPSRRHQFRARGSRRQATSDTASSQPSATNNNNSSSSNNLRLDHSVSKIRAKVRMPSGKSDRATIVDNKDGTVKISYEPKEVGAHEISLRYNDEPIDESPIVFYVDAVGAAKKKITAYGPGLTRGQAGEANKFTINTGGLGSAKLQVSVDGPSKTRVELQDNKDGTIGVGYTPLAPGEYSIKISFDGKQVIGSPFATSISDEGRQRSQISVGRGSEHSLELKVGEEDLKALNGVIVTPCGLEEPCGLKLLKNGQLAIVFTPREQGEHLVNVRRRGNHIAGSPFRFEVLSRDIGDAKQVRVSGKGLKEGKTNADNELIINTKEAGYGGLSVALEGPGKSEISSAAAADSGADGAIRLNYRPYEPGQYSLSVKYADHVVPGSPFSIKVTGAGTNPQKEALKKFRKVAPIADVNSECHFSFKMPGVSAYDLAARLHSPQGNSEDVSIKDKGDYVYQVSFTPKEVGLFSLSVRNKDIHLHGSPYPFTVGPLLDFGPHKVRCGGPGLIRGSCNKLNEFNVFTREAGAGELACIVEGPSKPELSYTDRKDGSCHIGYRVSQPGEYRISVLFNDQEVPESPFRAVIMPLTGDVSKIELGPMPPDNMIQLQKPCNFTVIMNGARGNIEGKVRLPSGQLEDCFASPIDAENWGVRFIPRELGVHQVDIKFNKGAHIPQSPVFIRVGHDRADPAAVMVHGQGLKSAVVNHATDFIVETCNAGHALLEVNIEGPSKVSMGCAELDEGYRIDYTPLAPGDYLIGIKYNGCHIGSSPFKVRAIKQPGSRTVADPGSHEISTIAIATSDREAKQKVEQMPKFKSDASRVYCKGMGLKKAFAGKPNTLTVNCSEAGFNMIYVSFLGPTRNTIHECSVKHMGGSIYEVKYTCKDRGDAILIVKYGDEQIPGSPFRLECV